jgi:hypothetical protein
VSQRQRQQTDVGKVISQEFFTLPKCTFIHGQSYIWIGPLTGTAAAHTPKAIFVKGPKTTLSSIPRIIENANLEKAPGTWQ